MNTAQATTLEPVQAPNRALAQVVAMARPPGSRPTHLYAASKARLLIPAWVANRPMMMNSGSTVKAKEAVVAYGVVVSSPRPNLTLPVMPMMPTKPTHGKRQADVNPQRQQRQHRGEAHDSPHHRIHVGLPMAVS